MKTRIATILSAIFACSGALLAQQPQTQVAPIFATNSKYIQGTSAGYWPQSGGGLVLNIAAGRVRCGNTMANYAGGTLTMANNTTNYVYLDATASCVPATNTTGYISTMAAIATVVTASGVITTITDDRTLGFEFKNGAVALGTVTNVSTGNLSPLFTALISNPSTTPALSFSLSNFAAHTFFGNNTGSSAAPGAQSIGEGDLPAATVFTDQNATFGAHTYDFSGVTLMKARVGAGLTTSANGDFGYDTTNKNWHFWANAGDLLMAVWDSLPTNGNCVKSSVVSSVVHLVDSGALCGAATSGSAGGDLSGTYPNPTVAKVNGGSIPASAHVTGTNSSSQPITSSADDLSVTLKCAAASASGTAYTCSTSPTFTPAAQDEILFKADVANTGAVTLNVNSSSAAAIKKQGGGTALVANDLLAGQWVDLIYDGSNWQMQGQTGNAAAGSSVTLTMPAEFTVSGTGPITVSKAAESGGQVWATPSGNSNIVQSKKCSPGGATPSSWTCSYTTNNVAGNALVLFAYTNDPGGGSTSAAASTVTDSNTNTWTTGATIRAMGFWYVCNAHAGANTVTISTGTNWEGMHIIEVTGNPTSSCLDTTGTATSGSSSISITSSGSASGSDLVLFGVSTNQGWSWTTPASTTLLQNISSSDDPYALYSSTWAANNLVGSGSLSVTITQSSSNTNATFGIIAGIKITGSITPSFRALDTGHLPASVVPLRGTTGSVSGALTSSTCNTGTATVTGATTSMFASASPVTFPGTSVTWTAYVSAANTVTVQECASASVTPTASAFNVIAIP